MDTKRKLVLHVTFTVLRKADETLRAKTCFIIIMDQSVECRLSVIINVDTYLLEVYLSF